MIARFLVLLCAVLGSAELTDDSVQNPNFFFRRAQLLQDEQHDYMKRTGDYGLAQFKSELDFVHEVEAAATQQKRRLLEFAGSEDEGSEDKESEEGESASESEEEEEVDGKKKLVKHKYKNLKHCAKSKVCCLAAGLSKGQLMNKCRGTQKKVSVHKCGCHNPATYAEHHQKKATKKPATSEKKAPAATKPPTNGFGQVAANQTKAHAKELLKNSTDYLKKKYKVDEIKKGVEKAKKVYGDLKTKIFGAPPTAPTPKPAPTAPTPKPAPTPPTTKKPTMSAAEKRNAMFKKCDGIKKKVMDLLNKAKFQEKALTIVNKHLKFSLEKPVAMTVSTTLTNATCLPVSLKVAFDSKSQSITAGPASVHFTGLYGVGTVDHVNGTMKYALKVGWQSANMKLFGKTFKFDDKEHMLVSSNQVRLPLPQMNLGKMHLTGLSVTLTKDPKSIAFTAKSNWPFAISVAAKFPAEGKPTISASAQITSFRAGSSLFGIKLEGLSVSGKFDQGDISASVMWKKGSVSTFGKKTEIPLAAPMTFDKNGFKVPLNSLDLDVVKLGKTTVSVTREPYQFIAVGSITYPMAINFDCMFPLAATDKDGKTTHPSIKLSTSVKKISFGNNVFGVRAEGITVGGGYSNGLMSVYFNFNRMDVKIFGATVHLKNGGMSYKKNEIIITIPALKLASLSLPGGIFKITPGAYDFSSSFTIQGKAVTFKALYNRTTGDVESSLVSKGITVAFGVKAGKWTLAAISVTLRSLVINYHKQTKAVSFNVEGAMVFTVMNLKIKMDPTKLFVSATRITLEVTLKDFSIYGAKPKIKADMIWDANKGVEAGTSISLTNKDVSKFIQGFFNANIKPVIRTCSKIAGPLAFLCKGAGAALNFLGKTVGSFFAKTPFAIQFSVRSTGDFTCKVSIAIGKALSQLLPFAKLAKVRQALSLLKMEIGVTANLIKQQLPSCFFRIVMDKGATLWLIRSSWFCKACPRFGIGFNEVSFKLAVLPKIRADFSGTASFEIFKLFNPFKFDTWVLKLTAYFTREVASTTFGLSLEVIKPVKQAFGIPGFNLNYIKIAVEVAPESPVILKSVELSLTADLGPITGLTIAGKLDIVEVTNNYLFFQMDRQTLSGIIGACIGKKLRGFPKLLDFTIEKTSMYVAFANVVVQLGGGKSITLKGPGFGCKTGIRFLGFSVVIDMGVYLKGVIPVMFINKFMIDARPLYAKIQAVYKSVCDTVTRVLNWKPLKIALKIAGKALLGFFRIQYFSLEGLEFDASQPMKMKLPSIGLGFVFIGMKVEFKLKGGGIMQTLKSFPKLFKAALKAFGNVWKWIKTLGLALWKGLKQLAKFVFNACKKLLASAVKFLGTALKNLGELFGNMALAVGKAFKAAIKWVGNAAKAIGKSLKKLGKAFVKFGKAAGKFFGKVGKGIMNAIKNPKKALKAAGKFIGKVIRWKKISGVAKKAWKGAKKTFKRVGRKVRRASRRAGRKVRRAFRRVGRAARRFFRRFGRRRRLLDTDVAEDEVHASAEEEEARRPRPIPYQWNPGETFSLVYGLKRQYQIFRKLDTNKDGYLTHTELADQDFLLGTKSCHNLRWRVKRGKRACGISIPGRCGQYTQDTAEKMCEKLGARLCSASEIRSGVVYNHGRCRNEHIWTSTYKGCAEGAFKVARHGRRAVCRNTFTRRAEKGFIEFDNAQGAYPNTPVTDEFAQARFNRIKATGFVQATVRACNSDKGCSAGASCVEALCTKGDGSFEMVEVGQPYWEERRAARQRASQKDTTEDVSFLETDLEPLELLSKPSLSVACAGGCPSGTICKEATCMFPSKGDAEFIEEELDEKTTAGDPTAQVRCCADKTPASGNEKSNVDKYWPGHNLLKRDNKVEFKEMILWNLGGKRGVTYKDRKMFFMYADGLIAKPDWRPAFKGYTMQRNFMPVGGMMKQMKGVVPTQCEQACTNPTIGYCAGFIVIRDICYLKTTATTGVVSGDKATGTYWFAKKADEAFSKYEHPLGSNMQPSSFRYLAKMMLVSARACARACDRPKRGVCKAFLIDQRGFCNLLSYASARGVPKQGVNVFVKGHRSAPGMSGYSRANSQSGGVVLAKHGRRSVKQCAKLCTKPAFGICSGFEMTKKGHCILKSPAPGKFRRSTSTSYKKKGLSSEVKYMLNGQYSSSKGSFKGSVFFRGKITAKNCRKFCDNVPVFIGTTRVRKSFLACAGFAIIRDGTCVMYKKITGTVRGNNDMAFRAKHVHRQTVKRAQRVKRVKRASRVFRRRPVRKAIRKVFRRVGRFFRRRRPVRRRRPYRRPVRKAIRRVFRRVGRFFRRRRPVRRRRPYRRPVRKAIRRVFRRRRPVRRRRPYRRPVRKAIRRVFRRVGRFFRRRRPVRRRRPYRRRVRRRRRFG